MVHRMHALGCWVNRKRSVGFARHRVFLDAIPVPNVKFAVSVRLHPVSFSLKGGWVDCSSIVLGHDNDAAYTSVHIIPIETQTNRKLTSRKTIQDYITGRSRQTSGGTAMDPWAPSIAGSDRVDDGIQRIHCRTTNKQAAKIRSGVIQSNRFETQNESATKNNSAHHSRMHLYCSTKRKFIARSPQLSYLYCTVYVRYGLGVSSGTAMDPWRPSCKNFVPRMDFKVPWSYHEKTEEAGLRV